jgi:hypothetical protein
MAYLRATIDEEIGKIGPSPSGCGVNPGSPATGPCRWGGNRAIHSLSSSTVDPPQPSDSASSGPIFVRNAARAKVNTRLWRGCTV